MGVRDLPPIDKTTFSMESLMKDTKKKEKKSKGGDDAAVKLVAMSLDVQDEIIDEYVDICDTTGTVKQLGSYIVTADFVDTFVSKALDRGSERDIKTASTLLIAMHAAKQITVDIIAEGLLGTIALIPDLMMDVPFAPKYFARLLSTLHMAKPALVGAALVKSVVEKARAEVESGVMATVAAEWLVHTAAEKSEEQARLVYTDCLNQLTGLLPTGTERLDFLEKHSLQRLDLDLLNRRALSQLFGPDKSPEAVTEWCKASLADEPETSKSPAVLTLCRSVMGCFLEYAVNTPGKDIKSIAGDMEKYTATLTLVLGRNLKRQLSGLLEVQHFCVEVMRKSDDVYPKELVTAIFEALYDQEIVYEESFMEWKDSTEDGVPGKMEAIFALNKWLVWLAEAEEEESTSDDE